MGLLDWAIRQCPLGNWGRYLLEELKPRLEADKGKLSNTYGSKQKPFFL